MWQYGVVGAWFSLLFLSDAYASCKPPRSDLSASLNVQVENDFFAPTQTDRHYTNGLKVSYTSGDSPPALIEWLGGITPLLDEDKVVRWTMSLGANMYTPTDITVATPSERDRPYAGWAYVSGGLIAEDGCTLDVLDVSVGMVGPVTQMGDLQEGWHRIIGAPLPKGWDDQLHNEPALLMTWERKYRQSLVSDLPYDLSFDLTPHVGVSAGNVLTAFNTGFTVRMGQDLPSDYGPPRIRPSLPGSDYFRSDGAGRGWYVFLGLDGRAVAQNIFLDGNTFRESRSVSKKNFVADIQGGVVFHFDQVRMAYTLVHRTREFDGQADPDMFAALTTTFRF